MLSVTAGRGPSEQQQQQQPRLSGHPVDVPMDLKKQVLMQQSASLEQPQDQDMAEEDDLPRGGESDGVEEDEDEADGEDEDVEAGSNVDADMSTPNEQQQQQNTQPSPQQQQQVQEILGQKIHDGGAVKYTVRWDNGDITEHWAIIMEE
ncbi:hypothetical protein BGZ73_004401 [Actinomortierella ambigua]|nr:hypothetical protein BGZ73_004401 [Actinomortierella ambigua]